VSCLSILGTWSRHAVDVSKVTLDLVVRDPDEVLFRVVKCSGLDASEWKGRKVSDGVGVSMHAKQMIKIDSQGCMQKKRAALVFFGQM
jgi:hypothetical protein